MHCVERSISLFCAQDFDDSELIILNTDTEHPIQLGDSLKNFPIKVFNSNTDEATGKEYRDVGSIRRDALAKASGDFYICWDDDDIFLPWNNQQCFDGISRASKMSAWKPFSSMCCLKSGKQEISQNYMEASYIVRMDALRACGFQTHPGGKEHMGWVHKFDREKSVLVDKNSIPAYSFNWSDPPEIGGHKNSGTINREDNYELHRSRCIDKHTRPLERIDIQEIIRPYVSLLKDSLEKEFNGHRITKQLFERYVERHL
jgi:hypothetical protein